MRSSPGPATYRHIAQGGLHRGNFKELADKGKITAESFTAEIPDVIAAKAAGRTDSARRIVAGLSGTGRERGGYFLKYISKNFRNIRDILTKVYCEFYHKDGVFSKTRKLSDTFLKISQILPTFSKIFIKLNEKLQNKEFFLTNLFRNCIIKIALLWRIAV